MGLPAGLVTKVVANEPCPPLAPPLPGGDPGRLVLTTVDHLSRDVWELTAEPIRGPPAGRAAAVTLRPTGRHRFYSETRAAWVQASGLEPGEVVRGRTGPLRVAAARPLPGAHRVYNLTVEGEHAYYVSRLTLLAHNTCAPRTGTRGSSGVYEVGLAKDLRRTPLAGTQVHHAPQSRHGESLIGNFTSVNKVGHEPAIRLPFSEHEAVTAAQAARRAPASARELLADEIRILRNYTNAPNKRLRELIDLSKDRHPYDYRPLHRTR